MIDKVILKEGPFKINELKPGEIQKAPTGGWYLACPRCGIPCGLAHDVIINDQKEVTISPSIGHPKTVNGFPNGCGAHYLVKNSKIEWCSDMERG